MPQPLSSIPAIGNVLDAWVNPLVAQPVQLTSGVTLTAPTSATYLTGATLTISVPSLAQWIVVSLKGKNATVTAAATITTGIYTGASAGTLTTLVGDSVVVAPTGGTTVAVNTDVWIPVTNATAGTTIIVSVGITASTGNYVLNAGATEPMTLAAICY